MSVRTPRLGEVLDKKIRLALEDLCVSCPATVQSYDPATQLATVRVDLKRAAEDADGNELIESVGVISNVPVVFPGGGGFAVTFPLAVDDTVLLVFADRSIDRWKTQGGEVDPGFLHSHNLSDAFALAGVRNAVNKLQNAASDRLRLGKDGGPTVEITTTDVILNEGAAKVARIGDRCSFTLVANLTTGVVTGQISIGGAAGEGTGTGADHVKA